MSTKMLKNEAEETKAVEVNDREAQHAKQGKANILRNAPSQKTIKAPRSNASLIANLSCRNSLEQGRDNAHILLESPGAVVEKEGIHQMTQDELLSNVGGWTSS